MKPNARIAEAMDEIINGTNVERFVHELEVDGEDISPLFTQRLRAAGFKEMTVGDVDVGFDQRVATFALRGTKAYFGWVFIERFTEKKSRKLFGSAVRNKKGDWAIQIPSNSGEKVFVNDAQRLGMELENNFVLE
ncbi:MAG: hypothetical protein M1469_11525 [Bacteroidetes bacterium]|nr:hypothetical protein [Bacteroidota bacterium]